MFIQDVSSTEMTDHLGYEKSNKNSEINLQIIEIVILKKTIKSSNAELEVYIHRDQESSF